MRPDAQSLLDALVAARPEARYRFPIYMKLAELVRRDPSIADELPRPWDLHGETVPSVEIGKLVVAALFQRGDVDGLASLLAAADAQLRWAAVYPFANNRRPRCLHVEAAPVVAALLDDDDPSVRAVALYFFSCFADHEHDGIDAWAPRIVALLLDTTRAPRQEETVATQARRTVTVAASARPEPFIEAARALLETPDAQHLREVLRDVLPAALEGDAAATHDAEAEPETSTRPAQEKAEKKAAATKRAAKTAATKKPATKKGTGKTTAAKKPATKPKKAASTKRSR